VDDDVNGVRFRTMSEEEEEEEERIVVDIHVI